MEIISLLQNSLNEINKVSPFNMVIKEEGKRTRLNFFYNEEKEDPEWTVDLYVAPIQKCVRIEDGNIKPDIDIFLRSCIEALLEKVGITSSGEPIAIKSEQYTGSTLDDDIEAIFSDAVSTVKNYLNNKSILFIDDYAKFGKSVIVKKYWQYKTDLSSSKLLWIDFNNGDSNFVDAVLKIIKSESNSYYIVLDNLECCELVNARRILKFFRNLTLTIVGRKRNVHLIVLQDTLRKVYDAVEDESTEVLANPISSELPESLDSDNYYFRFFYEELKANIATFLGNADPEYDSAKRLLFQMIVFGQYGVNVKLPRNEEYNDIVWHLRSGIKGVKRFYNGEICFYSKNICQKLYLDFKDKFCEIIEQNFYEGAENNIIKFYYDCCDKNKARVSVADFYALLKSKEGMGSETGKDLTTLLKQAAEFSKTIAKSVLSVSGSEEYYKNHLGAILFAAEVLSEYANDDWSCLCAWLKLHEYVVNTYFIKGQKLPEIKRGRESSDKTIEDFVFGWASFPNDNKTVIHPPHNCIENQIHIHDALLKRYNFTLDEITDEEMRGLVPDGEELQPDYRFNFFLSKPQEGSKIDMHKFFGTYILALLFEFEVSAPIGYQDNERIEILWEKIKKYCEEDKENEYASYYPQRIPWVTARMLLALCRYTNLSVINERVRTEINAIKPKLAKYLIKCCIEFNYNEERYGFWAPGTGLWNNVFETSILCLSAIKEAGGSNDETKRVIKNGERFIRLNKKLWFTDNKLVAEGLWAYQTIHGSKLHSNLRNSIAEIKAALPIISKDNLDNKNDKSLGFTHIAKIYVDLIKALVNTRPELHLNVLQQKTDDVAQETGFVVDSITQNKREGLQNNIRELLTNMLTHFGGHTQNDVERDIAQKAETLSVQLSELFEKTKNVMESNELDFITNEYNRIKDEWYKVRGV